METKIEKREDRDGDRERERERPIRPPIMGTLLCIES